MRFKSMKVWNNEIDKMIYAFDKIVNKNGYDTFASSKVKKGLKSFSENFGALWD